MKRSFEARVVISRDQPTAGHKTSPSWRYFEISIEWCKGNVGEVNLGVSFICLSASLPISIMSEWFTSLTAQAQQYAEQAKKQIDDLADNIAAQVETAQHEIDEERMKVCEEQGLTKFPRMNAQSLPWETHDEDRSILSQSLMEKILALSLCESNFTETPIDPVGSEPFDLQGFAPIIMKMLEIDSNLGSVHAKVSPNMNEEMFWKNYYQRIQFLRKKCGIDGEEAQNFVKSVDESKVIFEYVSPPSNEKGDEAAAAATATNDDSLISNNTTLTEEDEALKEQREAEKRREAELKLQQEIEAELEDDLDVDLDDLGIDDDDDLGDLDDLDGEIDEELEAQIAKELAEEDD